jgi:hypothetical protein
MADYRVYCFVLCLPLMERMFMFVFTSHGEDVHVRVGLLAIPRGPFSWCQSQPERSRTYRSVTPHFLENRCCCFS